MEQYFCSSLGYLLAVSRTYQCGVAQDKVFAPAAIALHQFSGKVERGLFIPDYQNSIEDVYTEVTGFIVNHTQKLSLLSRVEDKSFRSYHLLPSWVPDFSVIQFHPLDALKAQREFDVMRGSNFSCKSRAQGKFLHTGAS